jgi:hypothetical protein
MKRTIALTLVWLASTFLLLSWLLYGVSEFGFQVKLPSDARTEAQVALERAKAIETRMHSAKTLAEIDSLLDQEIAERQRYSDLLAVNRANQALVQRAFVLWGVMAFVPLAFLWWSHFTSRLKEEAGSGDMSSDQIRQKV